MDKSARIFVAGNRKAIGSAVVRAFRDKGFTNLSGLGDEEPDFNFPGIADEFFRRERPEYVVLAGGRVGGIQANQDFPADLMLDNVRVQTAALEAAHRHGVKKLLYLGSSCCYPRLCPQPMKPEHLFTGPVEPTNEAYALAKLAGLTMCKAMRQQHGCDFITALPANYFGPGDDFSPDNSHVVGALMRRMNQAREDDADQVLIWGTGAARREFICVDDLADACIFLLENYSDEAPINIGSGEALSIAELAEAIRDVTGFKGELAYDTTKPDGMPVKMMDAGPLLAMGWKPSTNVSDGLKTTFEWFLENRD